MTTPKLLNLQIIQVYEPKGKWVEEDPHRLVRCRYTTDGVLIAKEDPINDGNNNEIYMSSVD